eukprot:9351999-Pyramimonas_sp.AAC.1
MDSLVAYLFLVRDRPMTGQVKTLIFVIYLLGMSILDDPLLFGLPPLGGRVWTPGGQIWVLVWGGVYRGSGPPRGTRLGR